jgi:hypothetical protein
LLSICNCRCWDNGRDFSVLAYTQHDGRQRWSIAEDEDVISRSDQLKDGLDVNVVVVIVVLTYRTQLLSARPVKAVATSSHFFPHAAG